MCKQKIQFIHTENNIIILKRREMLTHELTWKSRKHQAKWNKLSTKGQIFNVSISEALKIARVDGNANTVSIWDDKRVLKSDSSNGSTSAWKDLMPLNRTLKNCQDGNLYIMPIFHNKKEQLATLAPPAPQKRKGPQMFYRTPSKFFNQKDPKASPCAKSTHLPDSVLMRSCLPGFKRFCCADTELKMEIWLWLSGAYTQQLQNPHPAFC